MKHPLVRMASVIAGLVLSMTMVVPVAHADPIADIRGTVARDRANSGCPDMKYNQTLQDIAFAQADYIPAPPATIDGMKASYKGAVTGVFVGQGDPMADALTKAYQAGGGPAIGSCSNTEFGVSFRRNENYDPEDLVGLVFGTPAGSATSPAEGQGTPPQEEKKPDVQCGPNDETPTVPAGQQCKAKPAVQCPPGGPQKEVPAGQKCPPPTNAVRVNIQRVLSPFWPVTVTNNAGIGGSCSYVATDTRGGLGHTEEFDIAPNGQANFSVPAPVIGRTYKVVTSCTGTYDGQQVEFGHDEQTVSL